MGWLRQESSYERRMRELEEEAERIRKNMQDIVKNSGREITNRTASSSTTLRQRSYSSSPQNQPRTEPRELIERDALENSGDDEENDTGQSGTNRDLRSYLDSEAPASAQPNARSNYQAKPEKLANYLASGSFGKRGSLSSERRIQRNKAIFMLIVAIIAIYSLYAWFK